MHLDLVVIEHDLSRLVSIIEEMKTMTILDQQILSKMFVEICKVYSSIYEIISPYYKLQDDNSFKTKLSLNFYGFKSQWLNSNNEVNSDKIGQLEYSCIQVQRMLEDLSGKIDWRMIKPSIRNEFNRVRELRTLWFLNDSQIYDRMRDLLSQLRDGLFEAELTVPDQQAFSVLQEFISESQSYFTKIESQLNEICNKRSF
jgi:hypothetical protein